MEFYPSIHESKKLSSDYDFIPLSCEILADTRTPINMFLSVKDRYDNCFLLESAENGNQWGRYSFIGFDPEKEIRIVKGEVFVTQNNHTVKVDSDPISFLSGILNENTSPRLEKQPRLTGGLIGWFAYDFVRYVEPKLNKIPYDDLANPDVHLLYCKEIIAFDHLKHTMVVIVNMDTKGDIDKNYELALERAKKLVEIINSEKAGSPIKTRNDGEISISSNMTKEQYMKRVEKVKQNIVDGDIFQIVLSHRFEVENHPDPFDIYRMLRVSNPSPYMYFYKFKDYCVVGASPEMLVNVEQNEIHTRPIAGTIRRGKDEKEDLALENALISDEKELAEHTMLVDLSRNDLGKVSKFGTVEVGRFMAVEKYSQLMHLVSGVKGMLEVGKNCLDVLAAVLPAGTLSGAPKFRAMQLIDEIELTKRGLYGGTIGYIGFDGNMDTCIAIRTILFKNNKAYIQSGAGIVADSIPEKEFVETETKARAMINAIMEAGKL